MPGEGFEHGGYPRLKFRKRKELPTNLRGDPLSPGPLAAHGFLSFFPARVAVGTPEPLPTTVQLVLEYNWYYHVLARSYS